MGMPRVLTLQTLPASLVFRSGSSATVSSLRPCQQVLRAFSSGKPLPASSKRKMQTSTAYQPYSLSTPPLPPRNIGPSETSHERGIPQVNNSRPSKQITELTEVNPQAIAEGVEIVGILKEELPEPDPSTILTGLPRAKPRPRLRARKAAISLTPGAVERLRLLLEQPSPKLIKIGVRNRGCSGLAYHLEYVDKAGLLDEEVEQDGVKVIIDSKALFSIIGTEVDWVEDKLSQRFVFKNPNIKEQCGCGESFMV